jgi:hypothetical protein
MGALSVVILLAPRPSNGIVQFELVAKAQHQAHNLHYNMRALKVAYQQ